MALIRERYQRELEEAQRDRFYSTEEVAELLKCCPDTVRSYRRDGKLAYYQVGRRRLHRWCDVAPLIDACFTQAA